MGIRAPFFIRMLALAVLLAPSADRSIVRADDPEPGADPEPGGDPEPGDGDLGGGEEGANPEAPMDPKQKAKLDKRIKQFIEMFKKFVHNADVSIVTEFLKYKGNRALLSSDPGNCATLCIEAAGYLAAAPKAQLEDAQKAGVAFVEIAQKCLDTHKEDRLAKVALAGAQTLTIRVDLAMAKPVSPERFVAVADLLVDAYTGGTADSGSILAKGIGWLREGVDEVAAARAPLIERTDKLIVVIPTLPEGPGREMALAQARLLRAVALGPVKGKADGDACLKVLAPFIGGAQPRTDAQTLHNETVAWAKRNKLLLGADFLFERATYSGTGIGWAVPSGSRWENLGSDGVLFAVQETNHRGRIVRRIECDFFKWGFVYIFDEDGKEVRIGADNSKGLAKKAYLDAKKKEFVTITGQKDLVKAPFAKNLAQAQMFEVVGTGQDGDYLRLRGYIFKAKEGAFTYMVRVLEMGDFPKVDPELEAFLDMLSEKPKAKGGK